MKKQNKTNLRRLLGALTALLVVAGIAVGVYWVGSLRGWFTPPPVTVETSSGQTVQIPPLSLTAKSITGKALVERGGLSFALEAGEALRAEDAVTLQGKGSLTVSNETLTLTFGDKASFLVGQKDGGETQITLNQGKLCAKTQGTAYFVVGNQSAQVTDGTVSLSVDKEAFVFDQLSGKTSFLGGDENVLTVLPKQRLTVQQTEGRWGAPEQKKLTLKQLSDFTLEQAKTTQRLCFTPEQLTGEIARREAEAQQKLEEQLQKETEHQEAEAKAKADAEAAEQAKQEQEAKQKAAEEKKAEEAKRKAEEEKKKQEECAMGVVMTSTQAAGAASTIYMIVMLVIMFALMYFLMIRPQKKEQKRVTAMLNDMEVGDAIVTTGGFYGVIIDITDEDVIVEFGNNKNCRIPMKKAAIAEVEKASEATA